MSVSPAAAGSGCATVAVAVPVADAPGVRVASSGTVAGSKVTGSLAGRVRAMVLLVVSAPGGVRMAPRGSSSNRVILRTSGRLVVMVMVLRTASMRAGSKMAAVWSPVRRMVAAEAHDAIAPGSTTVPA